MNMKKYESTKIFVRYQDKCKLQLLQYWRSLYLPNVPNYLSFQPNNCKLDKFSEQEICIFIKLNDCVENHITPLGNVYTIRELNVIKHMLL